MKVEARGKGITATASAVGMMTHPKLFLDLRNNHSIKSSQRMKVFGWLLRFVPDSNASVNDTFF